MKKFAILLSLCFIAILSNAQKKVSLTVADIDRSFSGIQTFKTTPEKLDNYYYDIKNNMLTVHHVSYYEQANFDMGIVYIYYKHEILLSDIDFKSIEIVSDCSEGCLLFIGAKKRLENVNTYTYFWASPDELKSKSEQINIMVDTESEALAFIEKLKSFKK